MISTKLCNGTTIRRRSGTEGPREDPYGWVEYTVTRCGHTYSLRHGGLSCVLTVDGREITPHNVDLLWPYQPKRDAQPWQDYYEQRERWLVDCFERRVGMDLGLIDKLYHEHFYFEDPYGSLGDYE